MGSNFNLMKSASKLMRWASCACAIFAMLMLTAITAEAAARVASVSGNWNAPATWGGTLPADIPVAGDTVTINSGITVIVTADAACASITFPAGNNTNINIDPGFTLTVSGLITIPRAGNGFMNILAVGAGNLNAGSMIFTDAGAASTRHQLTISTGTATVTGNITADDNRLSPRISFSGAGLLRVGGELFTTLAAGTLVPGTGTVEYNRDGAQTVRNFTYNNLSLSGSGVKTLTGVTVNGILSIEGTATSSVAPTYGAAAALRYNTAAARNAGVEWITPFAATGGVIIGNTGTITLNGAKVLNASVPLSIAAGATLNTGAANNYALTFGGTFTNSGTLTANGSTITANGNWVNNNIFNANTSTVVFASTGTSAVSGNTTFNNLHCLTASKTITFAAGSTQTVSGLLRINGTAFGTRVTLSSTGGAGTTWNLVLNGRHDCRYVAVQGSTASGTAFLPVNPVGFLDNGDNTNWYDSTFPRELLFYDNFETSTPSSTPPDVPSSYWTMTGAGGWFTALGSTVNVKNHTAGGSQSMYSSGGAQNQGIGCWNNPGWGPVTMGTAEVWFYDDMQNPKMQWIAEDNAVGDQWTGVLVDTAQVNGTVKYCYALNNAITVSYIDRTLGWHLVRWVKSGTYTILYLDGAELLSTSAVTDFADFDLGSWSWHNNKAGGSTSMWFDDCRVYRSQNQTSSRWYDNDSAQTPTALAAENTAVSRNDSTITRLRIQVQNLESQSWSNAYIGLQYRQGTGGNWINCGPSGDWNYANGLGTDKTQVANALLTGTNVRQYFVESTPVSPSISIPSAQFGEWDISIASTSNATIGATYYFRAVETNASGNYRRDLGAYPQVPSLTLQSATTWIWTGTTSSNWNVATNWDKGSVPNSTSNVIIRGTATNPCRVNISGAQCKSLYIESGANGVLLLDTASTSLTVANNINVLGTITHSNATASLTMSAGDLHIQGTGVYNHSAAGTLDVSGGTITVVSGGAYNVSGAPTIAVQTLSMQVGGIVNVTGAATFNIQEFTVDLNGQWRSTNTGNAVNISNNFTNNGSMIGSTGGAFNFTGAGKTMSGNSTTTIFYRANFAGSITSSITNDVTVLDNLTINNSCSFTSSTGNLLVAGNWLNSGTFGHGSGTVNFNGAAAQTVQTGGSNWNILTVSNSSAGGVSFTDALTAAQLRCTTPGATLFFKAYASSADTYTVTDSNGFYISGASGNPVKLRRLGGVAGDRWVINPSTLDTVWTADYVDVADSVNIAANPIFPTNYVDSGNTIYWFASDSNNNGIQDYWEYLFYRNLNHTATEDTDGDGLNTLLEYQLGTDPTMPFGVSGTIWVDSYTSYGDNDGSSAKPYKYLSDALDAASNKKIVMLKEGTYTLSNYTLTKDLAIRGEDPIRTIIKGPSPYGTSSDTGQMLNLTQNTSFALINCTVELYGDEQPIISYDVNKNNNSVTFENVIFKDNNTGSKSLIAPNSGIQWGTATYMFNCVLNNNVAAYAAELKGSPLNCYHNTVVNNTGGGLLVTGSGTSYLKNSIVRGNSGTQISFTATGPLSSVTYSNVQGGFTGTGNINSVETYLDVANDNFRLVSGSPGINAGTTTFVTNDLSGFARPTGAAVDLGAYEYQPTDSDGDGLTDAQEISAGTNPNVQDTDGDGYSDYYEINTSLTDPTKVDTDGDLISDGDEKSLGTNPLTFDGQMKNVSHRVNLYNESFESDTDYPVGPFSASTWGTAATYSGNIQIENVGAAAYDGSKVVTMKGQKPESYLISFVERNALPEWWIGISYKIPRVKVPTNVDEAFNIGGIYFTVDSNGYFCVYNGTTQQWMADPQVIPVGAWIRVYIHRYHAAKTADVWLEIDKSGTTTEVFTAIPIAGPDLANYIRISISSAQEFDVQFDRMDGYNPAYPPF